MTVGTAARKFAVVHDHALSKNLQLAIERAGHESMDGLSSPLEAAKGCHYAIVHDNLRGREPDFSRLKLDARTQKFLFDGRTPEETIGVMRNPRNYGVTDEVKALALTNLLPQVKFHTYDGLKLAQRLLEEHPKLNVIVTGGNISAKCSTAVEKLRRTHGERVTTMPITGFLEAGIFSPEKLARLFEKPRA